MKVKQQTLKGFECEIDDVKSFITYYNKNAPLMQGHLLLLKGLVNEELLSFLDEKKVAYVQTDKTPLSIRKKRTTAVLEEENTPKFNLAEKANLVSPVSMIFHRTIRSGELIEVDENLVFFGRINSGALVQSTQSIQSFGIIDGILRSDGEYLIIKQIGLGSVIFHGEELKREDFTGKLKLVQYKNNTIEISEI